MRRAGLRAAGTMNRVFQLRLEWQVEDDESPAAEQLPARYILPDEALRRFDEIARPFGLSARTVLRVQERGFAQIFQWPWCIIVLPGEYPLAGHVAALRGSPRNILMSSFTHVYNSLELLAAPSPRVAMCFVRKKGILRAVARRSPLFAAAWAPLADKDDETPWLCFPEKPSAEWLADPAHQEAMAIFELQKKQRFHVDFQRPARPVADAAAWSAVQEALQMFIGEQYMEAEQKCVRALEHDPNLAEAWHMLGIAIMADEKRSAEALKALREANRRQPCWIETLGNMAVLHWRERRLKNAIKILENILGFDPFDESALWILANVFTQARNFQGAIARYRELLDLEPKAGPGWFNLGFVSNAAGQREDALAAFEKAVACDPQNAIAWNNVGFLRAVTGRHDRAVTACERAIKLDPASCSAWDSLGYALLLKGDYEKAVPALLKALELQPEHPDAWRHLLHTYHRGGMRERFSSAMTYLRTALPGEAAKVSRELGQGTIS